MSKPITIFPGVHQIGNRIWTQNLVPKKNVYGERLTTIGNIEYREWTPHKSKLGAAIANGLKHWPFKPNMNILYLGSAEGTTISHISDVLAGTGLIIGIDISSRVMPKILGLSEQRPHLIPIIADANQPETYPNQIHEIAFDLVYQDVSQKNQTEIFLKNMKLAKPKAFGILVIKAPSIDSQANSRKVIQDQLKELEKHVSVLETIPLEPFEKKHSLVVCQNH